jgi:RNA polymerase sigma factor (sigma-70 family)
VSGWEGGYGDALGVDEVLDRFYRISHHAVGQHNRPTDENYDDLVQEGVVAAWKATQQPLRDPVVYGGVSARRRIKDIALGKTSMLGSERGGPIYDPMRVRPHQRESFDSPEVEMLEAADLLALVEMSYHRGTIMRAIATLPQRQREYVYLRFWQGMTNEEIGALRGTSLDAERSLWLRSIKPTLARELAHLR